MITLTELANRIGTDKGTQTGAAHAYSLIYDMMFSGLRDKASVDLLEMGLAIGGPELGGNIDRKVTTSPSVDMWLEFFPNSRVTGFDISDFSNIQNQRFTFVRGDSGRREDLEHLRSLGRTYDVILDDASHASYHQQLSLSALLDCLKPGGLYVIEDLDWQPEQIERSLPAVPRTAQILAEFLATGHLPVTAAISESDARRLERSIGGILLVDEMLLNAMGDGYNGSRGLPTVSRGNWQGRPPFQRVASPYFWLFSFRRFLHGLVGHRSKSWKNTKLAIIQFAPK
jgi:SAM-dependent methyltransferase